MHFSTAKGTAHPLGATPDKSGVNFSIFSGQATSLELLLFQNHDDAAPFQFIEFDPYINKTFHFWHVFVEGLPSGTHYAFRIDGPSSVEAGHRFNRNKVLIDPYAMGNTKSVWKRADACGPQDNLTTSMRSIVIDTTGYDWEDDQPLKRPMEETIIYEVHVGGFTRASSSGVAHPGTFSGIIEKIPYLQELGITAVELLPICDFDETEVLRTVNGKPVRNFWGYSTLGFFAPQASYCVKASAGSHMDEFRDLFKALHKAGIEVILDVVFNHTDEGNQFGPVFSFKGTDNSAYYLLDSSDKHIYSDYTGCGNTFNCNHPVAEKLIIDCLRHWVRDTHVDGFRFDEGSILSRGEDGRPLVHPPVVWQIELDEELAESKLIAEAWDAAGLYQIGRFPGDRWAEWNGRYRDDLRRFVKGDPGLTGAIASRLGGSADIYQGRGQTPENSINFITVHDGFTLDDLVSYNDKHNEANGEGNRDGIGENLSWNCGVEGPSDDPAIQALRTRQIKNFLTILLLSRGVPMLLGGDEVRRTQRGNNNAYNQDNATSWFDWSMVDSHREMLRFVQRMIAFRKAHPALWQPFFYRGAINERGLPDITWHGTRLNSPGFDDPQARTLACTIAGFGGAADLHVMMNMFWEPLDFEVPAHSEWQIAIDTFAASPHDIADPDGHEPMVRQHTTVNGRS